jgi:hypothetical protein
VRSWRCSSRVHWGLGVVYNAMYMVKVVPLFREVLRKGRVSRGGKPQWLEESDIFEFGSLPSAGRGRRGRWESDQILCRLCQSLFRRAGVGYGNAYFVGEGGPICSSDDRFDNGIVIVYGRKKGLKSMRFRWCEQRHLNMDESSPSN